MRYLRLAEVLDLHREIILQTGGTGGLRDLSRLQASITLPQQTFEGHDLYEGVEDKAAVLGFALIQNHPFVDGNKRVGHAALETMLVLNGLELTTDVDGAERTILSVASGKLTREDFQAWVRSQVRARTG